MIRRVGVTELCSRVRLENGEGKGEKDTADLVFLEDAESWEWE